MDGGVCVAASDGHKVHKVIYLEINKNNRVKISFSGVTRLTTAFLNAAVGQLYGEFSEETIRRHLAPPVDAEAWHLKRLKLVVDRAKVFFRDPEGETGLQFPVRRKRLELVRTRPTIQLVVLLDCTASTHIGSLKSGPVRV